MQRIARASLCAAALAALGFVSTATAGNFTVHTVGAPTGTVLNNTTDAQNLSDHPTGARFNRTDLYPVLNYKIFEGYNYGDWFKSPTSPDVAFPGLPTGTTVDDAPATIDFVVRATGLIKIVTSGTYTFDVNSDDGFKLNIGNIVPIGFSTNTPSYTGSRLNADTLIPYSLAAGTYSVDLLYFQRGGPGEMEFSAASGNFSTINSGNVSNFHLVGAADGLQLVDAPEPTGIALISLASLGLLRRGRRAL